MKRNEKKKQQQQFNNPSKFLTNITIRLNFLLDHRQKYNHICSTKEQKLPWIERCYWDRETLNYARTRCWIFVSKLIDKIDKCNKSLHRNMNFSVRRVFHQYNSRTFRLECDRKKPQIVKHAINKTSTNLFFFFAAPFSLGLLLLLVIICCLLHSSDIPVHFQLYI